MIEWNKLDTFTRSYLNTSLWASTSTRDGHSSLDDEYDINSIHQDTLKQMVDDCRKFQDDNPETADNPSRAGHDFWLTRNHHGAGFWDGDWPEQIGEKLTKASRQFGDYTLYIGDDDMIHGMNG